MPVKILPAYNFTEEILSLFSEYMDMLLENDPSFQEFLTLQNYDAELKDLTEKYGLPNGRLYIAFFENEAAGCIALRKINDESCEIKRFYIRPKFRGQKLGSLLLEKIMTDAKEIGYENILLDTLPFLKTAIEMYKRRGFYEIERYNNSPMDSSIFMKYDILP